MDSKQVTLTLPLSITVSIGEVSSAVPILEALPSSFAEEASRPRSYYEGYTGYDPGFLGVDLPLPTLTEEQKRNAAKNSAAKAGEDPTVFPYTHFSLVMNRRRQLAYYTVVNIDGSQSRSITRTNDRWFFDSRLAESEQIGEELYRRNKLDRGHLVRRLDPVWGSLSARANDDTFHFTNCSPQHEKFNQGQDLWQGLENYILDTADNSNRKVTVFTGPIMDEDDPIYKGVRLPLAFWKIIAYVEDGALVTAAYVLEQAKLIEDMLALEADFEPGIFRVSLDHLKERTGLDFDYLKAGELKITEPGLDGTRLESGKERVLVLAI